MIPARAEDLADIEAFLLARCESSMFPLVNLGRYGWPSDALRGVQFWLRREEGAVRDVLTVTNEGMVMPQCPTGPWEACAEVLRGRSLVGVIGRSEQARPLMAAAGLEGHAASLDRDEPFMELDLAALQVPEGAGEIVPVAEVEREIILAWICAYDREALNSPAPDEEIKARAERVLDNYAEQQSHVVLMVDGAPVALTGFNARLPQVVQIGGVYTPPAMRSRGYARRALALHLAQARDGGVGKAVLFSASEAARRSYAGIGFEQTGLWTLCLFDGPVVGSG